jgi:hypothetical protein
VSIIFIANVGERDIYYDVSEDSNKREFCHFAGQDGRKVASRFNCKEGARYISEEILKRFKENESEYQRLRYPILKTVIQEIVNRNRNIDGLYLIVTNQPETVSEEYRCRDTINSGKVLRELIVKDFKGRVPENENFMLVEYQKPIDRETSYTFFGKFLGLLINKYKDLKLHASLSGGIPALNDCLRDQAFRICREKCRFYEVIPPNLQQLRNGVEKGTLKEIRIDPFLKDLAIDLIKELLATYDYIRCLRILEIFKAQKFWDEKIEDVLRHAHRRINFNFKGSYEPIKKHKANEPFKKWIEDISDIVNKKKNEKINRLIELIYIISIKYSNEEYTDLLWRVKAFKENVKKLVNNTAQGRKKETIDITNELIKSLSGLGKLRDEIIHNIRGASLKDINDHFEPSNHIIRKNPWYTQEIYSPSNNHKLLIPTLREILIQLFPSMKERIERDPYKEINEYILNELKKYK